MAISTVRKATTEDKARLIVAWNRFCIRHCHSECIVENVSEIGFVGNIQDDDHYLNRLWQRAAGRVLRESPGTFDHPLCIAYDHVGYGGY